MLTKTGIFNTCLHMPSALLSFFLPMGLSTIALGPRTPYSRRLRIQGGFGQTVVLRVF